MQPLEILTKAQELIRDPVNWARGEMARDAQGLRTPAWSHDACSWCALGSLTKIAADGAAPSPTLGQAVNLLTEAVGWASPASVNDRKTHADVMAMFDRAKELALGRA